MLRRCGICSEGVLRRKSIWSIEAKEHLEHLLDIVEPHADLIETIECLIS